MAKTIEQLKAQGAEVKNATVVGENTATRVGTLFTDIVEYIEQATENGATTTNKLAPLAVTTEKIANGAVTTEKLADSVRQAIIYDVSSHNDGAFFESISALLSSSNLSTLIPTSVRHGGMTIRFIQGSEQSSDNKYVQYRLTAASFTTDVTAWQKDDFELLEARYKGYETIVKSASSAGNVTESLILFKNTTVKFTNNTSRTAIYPTLNNDNGESQHIGTIQKNGEKTITLNIDTTSIYYYNAGGGHTISVEVIEGYDEVIDNNKTEIAQADNHIELNKNNIDILYDICGGVLLFNDAMVMPIYDDGGTWYIGTGYSSYVLRCNKTSVYEFTANSNSKALVSFVKSIDAVSGGSIQYASEESRHVINIGETARYTAKDDAEYIVIAYKSSNNDRTPSSAKVEFLYDNLVRRFGTVTTKIDIASLKYLGFSDTGETYSNETIMTSRRYICAEDLPTIYQVGENAGIEIRFTQYGADLKIIYQSGWQQYQKGTSISPTKRENAKYFTISYRISGGQTYISNPVLPQNSIYSNQRLIEMQEVSFNSVDSYKHKNIFVDFMEEDTNYEITIYLQTSAYGYIHLMNLSRDLFMIRQMEIGISDVFKPYTFIVSSNAISPLLISTSDAINLKGISIKKTEIARRTSCIIDYAHLGYSAFYPYNTMAGYIGAIKAGFKGIVANVVETSDGVLMCYHDNDAVLTNDGGTTYVAFTGQEIREMTSAELHAYDAGLHKGSKFAGEKVPYLKDYLRLCSNNGIFVCLSIHPNLTQNGWQSLYTMLEECGLFGKVTIKSFNPFDTGNDYPNFEYLYSIFGDKIRYGYDCDMSQNAVDSFVNLNLGNAKKLIEATMTQISATPERVDYAVSQGLAVSFYEVYAYAGDFVKYVRRGATEITSDNFVTSGSWIYQ